MTDNGIQSIDQPQESPDLPPLPKPQGRLPASLHPAVINAMKEYAQAVARTTTPRGASSWEAILRIIMAGYEVGLPPEASLGHIHLSTEGKCALDVRAMVALIRERGLGTIELVESTDQHAKGRVHRNDWPDDRWELVQFTHDDAETAGLLKAHANGRIIKDNWRNYKPDMLIARMFGRGSNRYFQELMMYTPDELGMDTDQYGAAIDLSPTEPIRPPWERDSEDPERTEPPATTDAAVAEEAASEEELAALVGEVLTNVLAPPQPAAIATREQLNELGVLVRALGLDVEKYRQWIRRVTGVDSAKNAPSEKLASAIEVLSLMKQTQDFCQSAGKDGPASLNKAATHRGFSGPLDLEIAVLREIRDKARTAAGDPLS